MAFKPMLTILTIALCAHLSSANLIRWLYGSNANPKYNDLCPKDMDYTTVAMPDDECHPDQYISCYKGAAVCVSSCPENRRYDSETGWCEDAVMIPDPPGCVPEVEQALEDYPTTCVSGGPLYVRVERDCSVYRMCFPGTNGFVMPCQVNSFFIPKFQQCYSMMDPYRERIPMEFQQKCLQYAQEKAAREAEEANRK